MILIKILGDEYGYWVLKVKVLKIKVLKIKVLVYLMLLD